MSEPLHTRPPGRYAAMGGIGVVLLTGLAALFGMGANYRMEVIDWVLAGLILVLTVGGSIAMIRFIRDNPGQIGEARFDTSHADEPKQESPSPLRRQEE